MYYSIDRIENGVAVCEGSDGKCIDVSVDLLPEGAKAGSVIYIDSSGCWQISNDEEQVRRDRIRDLKTSIFKKNKE